MYTLIHRLVSLLAAFHARRIGWSPIGARVHLEIGGSGDAALVGRTIRGVIRSASPNSAGVLCKAIVELEAPLAYDGRYRRDGIAVVRTSPENAPDGLDRLLLTGMAVRVIDCDDPGDGNAVIATAAMRLDRRGSGKPSTAWLSLEPRWWAESLMLRVARRWAWTPLHRRAAIVFDDSGDPALVGRAATGTVRAWGTGEDGMPRELLVELDGSVEHSRGSVRRPEIRWLVTRPCLCYRRTARLIVGWSAVRFIDASSFRDATDEHTIGTGRLRILRR